MRKLILLFLCIVSSATLYAQEKEKKYKEKKVLKVHITAKEFEGGREIKNLNSVAEIHSSGKTQSFVSYNPDGTIKNRTTKNFSQDGLTETAHTKDKEGKITNTVMYVEDTINKTLRYYQINAANDTVVKQTRYFNTFGKDSILYTKMRGGKLHVSGRWSYDKDGEELLYESLNEDGSIHSSRSSIYRKDGDCKLYFDNKTKAKERKVCLEPGKEIVTFYEERNGTLYGIKIMIRENGRKITEYLGNGLTRSETYYDKKGKILSQIIYDYEYR